jgi:hypothetical protein
MKNLAIIFGLVLSINSFAGKCILNKAAVGQDGDMSELSEIADLIEDANPKCEFSVKKECEAFQMTNLFNIAVSPCQWIENTENKPIESKSESSFYRYKYEGRNLRCKVNESVSSCIKRYGLLSKMNQDKKITNLNCTKISDEKISCNDKKTYALVKELSQKEIIKHLRDLQEINSARHYWPHEAYDLGIEPREYNSGRADRKYEEMDSDGYHPKFPVKDADVYTDAPRAYKE